MFDRNFYIPTMAKIARDARIQERADTANELLYNLTNELDIDGINKSIALATELLYGAKASRPILESLISDLKKLATEHEQQELDLANGGVVGNPPGGSNPAGVSGMILEPVGSDIPTVLTCTGGGMIGALQHLGKTLGRALTNEELEHGGIVIMPKEKHDKLHRFDEKEQQFKILNMVSEALNTVKELSMSRNALNTSILQDVEKVRDMFLSKNDRYGQDRDGLFNFTQGAKLLYGDASPDNSFRTLMGYVSKHIVTLSQPDALTNDNEFEDRCLDVAVYMLIARAMKKATREGASNG